MQRTTLGLLLVFTSCACLGGSDIWENLFREKLKEAMAGSSNAQYDVGTMYQNGRGVTANRDKAIEWYRKAAAQDNREAVSRLNLIQSNEDRFNKTLARAGMGEVESQYDLGNMYTEGIGVDPDLTSAMAWYQKAANQEYEKAQFKLGLIYYEAGSVNKDHSRAFRLFKRAAEKGYPAAQFYLGKMYASGQGVKRNYEMALAWFRKAADGGFNEARKEISDIAALLNGTPADTQPEPVKTAMPEANPAAATPQEKPPAYTYEDLMLASWSRNNEPVAYLPSAINTCRVEDDRVVCFSDDQTRDRGTGAIKYKTKAIISNLAQDGSFDVVYRNLVIAAEHDSTPEKGSSAEVVGSTTAATASTDYQVKTGWGKEHSLQCTFKDSSTLSCLKNKTYAFLLENPKSLVAGK
jgi:TPR repeat protein